MEQGSVGHSHPIREKAIIASSELPLGQDSPCKVTAIGGEGSAEGLNSPVLMSVPVQEKTLKPGSRAGQSCVIRSDELGPSASGHKHIQSPRPDGTRCLYWCQWVTLQGPQGR